MTLGDRKSQREEARYQVSFEAGHRTMLPGALVLLSEGEYSSYAVKALFRVYKPIVEHETLAIYHTVFPDRRGYNFYGSELTQWLESEGYVRRQAYLEWHITRQYGQETMTLKV